MASRIGSPTLQRGVDRHLARVVLEGDDVLDVVERELRGDMGLHDRCARLSNAGSRGGINTCNQLNDTVGRTIILRNQTEQQKYFGGIFGGICS